LVITADDYGYARGYDEGILEAAEAGAIDAVSVMVLRDPDPEPLLATSVTLGVHAELEHATCASPLTQPDGKLAVTALRDQLARFEAIFAAKPAYVDGHRHCHAAPELAGAIAREAAVRGLAVRSVSESHRRTLRSLGVSTPDRLVGRLREAERALPAEIDAWLEPGEGPPGTTEWFVHPGHPDPASGSSYDLSRAEDLELVMRLADDPRLQEARGRALSPPQ